MSVRGPPINLFLLMLTYYTLYFPFKLFIEFYIILVIDFLTMITFFINTHLLLYCPRRNLIRLRVLLDIRVLRSIQVTWAVSIRDPLSNSLWWFLPIWVIVLDNNWSLLDFWVIDLLWLRRRLYLRGGLIVPARSWLLLFTSRLVFVIFQTLWVIHRTSSTLSDDCCLILLFHVWLHIFCVFRSLII